MLLILVHNLGALSDVNHRAVLDYASTILADARDQSFARLNAFWVFGRLYRDIHKMMSA